MLTCSLNISSATTILLDLFSFNSMNGAEDESGNVEISISLEW